MHNNRLSTPHNGAGERGAGAGGFLHRLVAERDQRHLDDREQRVEGLGAGPSDDVCNPGGSNLHGYAERQCERQPLTSKQPQAGETA